MLFSKERRLDLYVEALAELQKGDGFCSILDGLLSDKERCVFVLSIGLPMFPELEKYRPSYSGVYWFPIDEAGYRKRIHILATIIAEMSTTT